MGIRGRCLCGDVRFEIASTPEVMGVCHCRDCQRQTGSAFSTMASVPKADFTISRGVPQVYAGRETKSGNAAEVCFCGSCGSPICTLLADQPDVVYVKTGALEDTSWFEPQFHVWTDHKQQWVNLEPQAEGKQRLRD